MSTVLVVDDEHEICAAIQSILEDEGFAVVTCSNGQEAVEKLAQGSLPDLVLSDVMMPRLSGYDLVAHIRADSRLGHLRVVLMSSISPPIKKGQASWNAFLKKPFSLDQLLTTVNRYSRAEGDAHQEG